MALLPYTLIEPLGAASPLVVDSPHSGRIYPVDFGYTCPLSLLRQAEDAYVDEIIGGAAKAGAGVILAEFPRSMIDPNRAEDDMDPTVLDGPWPKPLNPSSMTLQGYGLIRRVCRNGIALYHAPLTVAEAQRRIENYYRPYHKALHEQVAARLRQFGVCYLLNVHSMPDRVEGGVSRPDFILGDRDGMSCYSGLTSCAQKILLDMGYRVSLNEPYKGREIVERYGLKGQGAQALQIEINRRLYLNEMMVEKNDGFDRLCHNMTKFFHLLSGTLTTERDDRLAAE